MCCIFYVCKSIQILKNNNSYVVNSKKISFYSPFLKWGFIYPVPVSKRPPIMVDYYNLYKKEGLTKDEYVNLGFENLAAWS